MVWDGMGGGINRQRKEPAMTKGNKGKGEKGETGKKGKRGKGEKEKKAGETQKRERTALETPPHFQRR